MLHIGIIGSDNSHAMAFSRLANLPDETGAYAFPDVRVTMIYGSDSTRTREVADAGQIPEVVQKPEDMLGRVDAVMVVFRHGGLHYSHALPFVRAGVPTWVDKPFCIDSEEALKLVLEAKTRKVLLAGGSTCKYCPDVIALQREFITLNSSSESRVISGAFNFPGEIESPYGGIWFYGGHAAEILTTIFGGSVRSIRADVHCGNIIAIAKYDDFTVTINFSEVSQFYGALYSPARVVQRPIDISTVYREGFGKYVEALRLGEMLEPYDSLLRPISILRALDEAIRSGKEVSVSSIDFSA